ncbi:MAG: type III ribulose-bisphosphate carboxylase [Thaumarchaeota archaeon]|jgi:ribulose-bisphosphate carboxylase large chain|nr:type III ribulose-bisphosphate carboxylase [Nitrososphaerota archaeon]
MSEEKVDWYLDFIDLKRKPAEDEIQLLFKATPAPGYSIEEAAGRIASESSVGTWTTLTTITQDTLNRMAKVYKISGDLVYVTYPLELFELGSIPQLFSSVFGNIYGMKTVARLRVIDIRFPKEYIKSFKGPQFGQKKVKDILKIKENRPIIATVPKPKLSPSAEAHAKVGYEIWLGGEDLLKDDENLTSQPFIKFEDRVREVFKYRDKAEKETGERKSALINVTAETEEMKRRVKLVKDYGGEFIMIDFLTAGWAAVQTIRDYAEELGLALYAHRAFHAAFTKLPDHGATMLSIAKVARLAGVDFIHIGTAGIGKMESTKSDVIRIKEEITLDKVPQEDIYFEQDWAGINPVMPVSSGGLHPGILPPLLDALGADIAIQVGGGVLGHPMGPRAGAKAVRDAIDAWNKKIPLQEYAEKSKELKAVLEKWGTQSYA